MSVIRSADIVYVLPVTSIKKRRRAEDGSTYTSLTPRGDFKRTRLLGREASRALRKILGDDKSWFHAHDSTFGIGPEPKNGGNIFRRGHDELVLLGCMRWRFEGTFNGAPTGGSLEEKASDRLDEWKIKKSELSMTSTLHQQRRAPSPAVAELCLVR
jgi:hypothetical protein